MLGVSRLHCCRHRKVSSSVVSLHKVPMSNTSSLWSSSARIEISDVVWMELCMPITSLPSYPVLPRAVNGIDTIWPIPAPVNRIRSATAYRRASTIERSHHLHPIHKLCLWFISVRRSFCIQTYLFSLQINVYHPP